MLCFWVRAARAVHAGTSRSLSMRSGRSGLSAGVVVCLWALSGCGTDAAGSSVVFGPAEHAYRPSDYGGGSAEAGFVAGTTGSAGASAAAGRSAAGTTGAAGAPAAGSSAAGVTSVQSAGSLSITFTTVDPRGRYSPRNIGAVWIETADGKFVKTVERWAGVRARDLRRWTQQSGGWPSTSTPDRVDAVSRATLRSHETHTLTWNLRDASGAVVPDGSYKVFVEMTDRDSPAGAYSSESFEKRSQAQDVPAETEPPYSAMALSYRP